MFSSWKWHISNRLDYKDWTEGGILFNNFRAGLFKCPTNQSLESLFLWQFVCAELKKGNQPNKLPSAILSLKFVHTFFSIQTMELCGWKSIPNKISTRHLGQEDAHRICTSLLRDQIPILVGIAGVRDDSLLSNSRLVFGAKKKKDSKFIECWFDPITLF